MSHPADRIGPNAILRVEEALRARPGGPGAEAVFAAAGLQRYLATPPAEMVDEREVTALHAALRSTLDPDEAARVSYEAGRLTADYLLANRIPRPVQSLLHVLPAPIAARVLVRAIGGHAWTFAGTGVFTVEFSPRGTDAPLRFSVRNCPICRGATSDRVLCDYYAATFERLFKALVRPSASVSERACQSLGAPACLFDLWW